jgi:hypothetical protein
VEIRDHYLSLSSIAGWLLITALLSCGLTWPCASFVDFASWGSLHIEQLWLHVLFTATLTEVVFICAFAFRLAVWKHLFRADATELALGVTLCILFIWACTVPQELLHTRIWTDTRKDFGWGFPFVFKYSYDDDLTHEFSNLLCLIDVALVFLNLLFGHVLWTAVNIVRKSERKLRAFPDLGV